MELDEKYPKVEEGCPKGGNEKWTACECWKDGQCTDVEHFVSAGDEHKVLGLGTHMLCYIGRMKNGL